MLSVKFSLLGLMYQCNKQGDRTGEYVPVLEYEELESRANYYEKTASQLLDAIAEVCITCKFNNCECCHFHSARLVSKKFTDIK